MMAFHLKTGLIYYGDMDAFQSQDPTSKTLKTLTLLKGKGSKYLGLNIVNYQMESLIA